MPVILLPSHIGKTSLFRTPRLILFATLVLAVPGAGWTQSVTWRNLATFYADNTEFFTPFRIGETIFGAQAQSFLDIGVSPRTSVRAGVFGDRRFGSEELPVKPIISFRYETPSALAVLGTLETVNRHGYLEPLEVTTLEFTRPIEYGAQLVQRHRSWDLDVFLDWQGLNTPTRREIVDYGLVFRGRPVSPLTVEVQLHGLHHGGQLDRAGEPVRNNKVIAVGARLRHTLPVLGNSSVAGFYVSSKGFIDSTASSSLPDRGHGVYLRASAEPTGYLEVFSIYWAGRDFHTEEGDHSYNSLGARGGFYRSRRRYFELGAIGRTRIDGRVWLDAEFRFHRVDDEKSAALLESKWEYSYRLVVRAPFDFIIHRAEGPHSVRPGRP